MDFGKRMKEARLSKGITLLEIAEKLGRTEATIQRYESGNIKNLKSDTIEAIAKSLNVKPAYLMGWLNEDEVKSLSNDYTYYPTAISAGLPINVEAVTQADKISIPDSLMGKYAGSNDLFITKINGESMNKVMKDGSTIAVKPTTLDGLKNGDIVVFSNNYEYSVKRFYKFDDVVSFRPDSDNLEFGETRINVNEIDNLEIHGKVVYIL